MLPTRLQFVLYAGVVTLLSAGAAVVTYRIDQQELAAAAAAARLKHVARLFASGVQHALGDVLKDGRVMATAIEVTAAAGGEIAKNNHIRELFRRQIETHPDVAEVRFVGPPPDSREQVVYRRLATGVGPVPESALKGRGYCPGYRATVKLSRDQAFVSPVMWDEDHFGKPVGPVVRGAVPLRSGDRLLGIVALTLDLAPLFAELAQEAAHEAIRFHIADSSGFVFHPQATHALPGEHPLVGELFPELEQAARRLQVGDAWHTYTQDDSSIVLIHRFELADSLPGRRLDLVLTQPLAAAILSPDLLGKNGLAAITLLGLLAIGSALYLLNRVSSPLSQLSRRARRIAEGDYAPDTGARNGREITRELEAEMDRMAISLERREQELRAANRRLERLNLEIEQFTYLAAHDLKAPLRAVSHIATVIQQDLGSGKVDTSHPLLPLLTQRTKRMHGIIDSLLLYARAGDDEAPVELVDSGELVWETVAAMVLPEGAMVEVDPQMPVLPTRRAHLREVFRHLIENAVRHHDRPAEAHIRISVDPAPEGFRFTVADDGPGIPVAYRHQIFRMFQVLDPGKEAAGIGLAIAAKIVIANGGHIDALDNAPRGTRCSFTWGRVS